MGITIEYNSKLAVGDKITFYLDNEKIIGEVKYDSDARCGYWIECAGDDSSHCESVCKIFSYFGISSGRDFRDKVIGRDWEGASGIWPYTSSLEELKKMLDEL